MIAVRLTTSKPRRWAIAEIGLIFLLFFVVAGSPPPGVNEAHYLGKAKHYWDPSWCSSDFFLAGPDAHLVFYWTFGWLTRCMSLTAVAWTGRVVTWILLAWSWRRLSVAVLPGRLIALLTAALFATLMRWGHMAGEWVVGGVEAKGFAFVLLFLALERLVRGKWQGVWPLLGGATSFHVLVGGWGLLAALFAWCGTAGSKPASLKLLLAPFGGLLLALPGLVFGLSLNWNADADMVREAHQIYVFQRLDHHLVFHQLPWVNLVRHGALLLAWFAMVRGVTEPAGIRRLQAFVAGAVLIALAGVAVDLATLMHPALAATVLRFYWFRLCDAMLPLGVAFAVLQRFIPGDEIRSVRDRACLVLVISCVTADVTGVAWEHWRDRRPDALQQSNPALGTEYDELGERFRDWQQMCRWIAEQTPPETLVLAPRGQQTFRWYAGRAEVVNWKDIPQDAAGILQWWQRMLEIYPLAVQRMGLTAHGEAGLIELARKYGFDYLVLDRSANARPLAFERVYPVSGDPSACYEVYRVPKRGGVLQRSPLPHREREETGHAP